MCHFFRSLQDVLEKLTTWPPLERETQAHNLEDVETHTLQRIVISGG